ncbi:hypothetical protein F5X97DRAFT_340916 [Nemania serpens]|nr:hypothetical protein F5X97DRAFT_340916 [Nemania serpens]
MERKSVDSHAGSSMSFETAQESFGSAERVSPPRRPTSVSSAHFTPAREESAFISGSPWEITPKPKYKHIETPREVSPPEEPKPKPKPPTPESKKHYSTFVPSQPIPIPGAVPKRRVATRQEDGALAVSGSTAPRTEKEIEEMEKEDARDQALAEKYERMKADMMKWHADKQCRFIPGHPANIKHHSQSSSQSGNQSNNWARKSFGRLRDILSAGRIKDMVDKSDFTDEPVCLKGTDQFGEAAFFVEEDLIPKYQQTVMQPFANQYGHTTATVAYEEGLKTGRQQAGSKSKKSTAFKEGYMAGLAQARKEKEYKLGYQAGLTAYDSPFDAKPVHEPLPWEEQRPRSPLKRKDGFAVMRYELIDGLNKLMDKLEIAGADGEDEDENEDPKGKGVARPRQAWEVAEFVKDMAYELRYGD